MNTRLIAAVILTLFLLPVFAGGGVDYNLDKNKEQNVPQNSSVTWTVTPVNCSGTATLSVVNNPPYGTATISGLTITYNNDGTNGYLPSGLVDMKFKLTCSNGSKDVKLKVQDSGSTGGSTGGGTGGTGGGSTSTSTPGITCSNGGVVIFDMTTVPGTPALTTNLAYIECGSKSDTAIDDGLGGNAINVDDYHVLNRKTTNNPNELELEIGPSINNLVSDLYGTPTQLKYFANGQHLFDLDRLRAIADWLSTPGNVTPDTGVAPGTYGTITLKQFIKNIADGVTMYGVVRVKIPLKRGATSSTTNALGQATPSSDLYGFCPSTSATGCSCSPGASFSKIQEGLTICGYTLPASAKIKVKGSLFWDFVDADTGAPIPLANLPFAPRELYFKVEIPIMVNWSHDLDDDGAMDNMFVIKALTAGLTPGIITPVFDYTKVPQSAKDEYKYQTGKTLTQAEFDSLDPASKYHLMMPIGYADGWAEAFDKLNITAGMWKSIVPSNPLGVPSTVTSSSIMTANDVRSNGFEDIPVYLYSGGLIDMHDHVNISGLVYVPQGMELEAKNSSLPTRQYIVGAVVVRDTFYIEAKSNTITVFSADPNSYSTAKVNGNAVVTTPTLTFEPYYTGVVTSGTGGTGGGGGTSGSTTTSGGVCYGCGTTAGGGTTPGTGTPGPVNWVEIRPEGFF